MSTTVKVPGGTATFLSREEITPRRRRGIQVAAMAHGPLFAKIQAAQQVTAPNGDATPLTDEQIAEKAAANLALAPAEAEALMSFTDLTTFAYLSDWTVTIPEGNALVKRPLPADADALLDLPTPLYDALTAFGAQIAAAEGTDAPFQPSDATLADQTSPTGP